MSDTLQNIQNVNEPNEPSRVEEKSKYTLDYALEQIEKINLSTAYLDNAILELRKMKTTDGVGDIANQAKAQALADVVRCRETTNQKLLDFYMKMIEDLKPTAHTTERVLAVLDNAVAGITSCPYDSAEAISNSLDSIRQIFRENIKN